MIWFGQEKVSALINNHVRIGDRLEHAGSWSYERTVRIEADTSTRRATWPPTI